MASIKTAVRETINIDPYLCNRHNYLNPKKCPRQYIGYEMCLSWFLSKLLDRSWSWHWLKEDDQTMFKHFEQFLSLSDTLLTPKVSQWKLNILDFVLLQMRFPATSLWSPSWKRYCKRYNILFQKLLRHAIC